ncbi:unnamed protein product [Staurois parvus]|uniref:Uncharacterized protein n=1 Tax=Staurois parvus TaxID=386267 RepID=A0ABN9H239_9NEOB|nr:unnamed protein product [Staurois parvus]
MGCQYGFASTSGRILGALWACVCEFFVAEGQYLCSPPHQLVLHLWDLPRRQVILQCWYMKDPGCTRPLVLASSPKGSAALVLAPCCI